MWEIARYNWGVLRASGSAQNIPAAITALLGAATEAEADRAYWQIDNTVVVQGALFEAAVPTAACLAVGLSLCSEAGRGRVLELLLQLCAGEDALEEAQQGGAGLAHQCVGHVILALAQLCSILETGNDEERPYCVDLLGLCARQEPSLRSRVRWYLEQYQQAAPPAQVAELTASWLSEL